MTRMETVGWHREYRLRALALLLASMTALVLQVWRPSQAWPELALLLLVPIPLLAALACGFIWSGPRVVWRRIPAIQTPLLLTPCLAAVFLAVRTWLDGWPATGMDGTITHLQALLGLSLAWVLGRFAGRQSLVLVAWFVLIVVALMAFHAILQRHFLYPATLSRLLAEGVVQDPITLGIIHHLRLGRVASVWGDPNILALALAMSIPVVALALGGGIKPGLPARGLAMVGAPLLFWALLLTGSRGGVLDAILMVSAVAVWIWVHRGVGGVHHWIRPARLGALLLAGLVLWNSGARATEPNESAVVSGPHSSSNFWTALGRVDTIRERLNYARVGVELIQERPWTGSGPGAVERHWGRLKPPEAREARMLHNWPLMVAVEYGIPALLLLMVTLGWLFYPLFRIGFRLSPVVAALGASAAIYWWDGLLQLSFNHREISLWSALVLGLVLSRIPCGCHGWWKPLPSAWVRILALINLGICTAAAIAIMVPWSSHERRLAQSRFALEQGRAMEALSEARKALQWLPEQAAGYRALAGARAALGDRESALRDLDRAARLDPWRVSLALQRADLLVSSRKPEEALEVLERVRPYYPSHPGLHRKRAEVFLALGQLGPAVEAARLAVQHGYLNLEQDQAFLRQLEQKVSPSSGAGGTGSATHIPGSGS